MKILLLFFPLYILTIIASAHPGNSVRDTIRLDEVTVTGTMTEVNLQHLPMSVSIVNRRQIERRFDPSLLPVIAEEVPGLFITGRGVMGYGIAEGSAGGMSIRGIGGSPTSQLLVLIDGHPQYMGLMGHPLPDAYQCMMAERVEVVRGPASILYGSNAMGGVINIITRRQPDGIHTNARLMYGSFNTLSAEAGNSFRSGKFSSTVSLGYNRSDGHRENMEFGQYSGYVKVGYDLSPNWNVTADLNVTHFSASNPGTVKAPIIDNDAEVTRGMTSLSLINKYGRTSGAFKFFYNFGIHKINNGFQPGGTPLDYRFRSKDKMSGISLYQTYSLLKGNQTTAGIDYQYYGGHAWNKYSTRDAGIADKQLQDIAGYVNIQQTVAERLTLNAGIRIDHNGHTGTAWIPQAGLSYAASASTILKAIVSKGFRNPSIREMYMFPPQNPNLKAERLMNYELSGMQSLLQNTLHAGLSLYYINGSNSIQTVIAEGKPQYQNTGKIKNYGLEMTARYEAGPYLDFSANYSWLHMKYPVLAAPEHKLYAGMNYTRRKWGVSTGVQYIANLYTSTGKNTTTEDFTLWNIRASWRPFRITEFFVRGENILAQHYEINAGYPMPRATISGGVDFHF